MLPCHQWCGADARSGGPCHYVRAMTILWQVTLCHHVIPRHCSHGVPWSAAQLILVTMMCGPVFDLWLIISLAMSPQAPHTSEIFKIVTTDIIIISDPLNIISQSFKIAPNECYLAWSSQFSFRYFPRKSLLWTCVTNSIFFSVLWTFSLLDGWRLQMD